MWHDILLFLFILTLFRSFTFPNYSIIQYIKTIKNRCDYNCRQLLLAILAYILANIFDYIVTLYGLAYTNASEANPIAKSYIAYFGVNIGLLIFKSIIVSMVIIGILAFYQLRKTEKIRLKPEHILSIGTIITFLGASLWLTYL